MVRGGVQLTVPSLSALDMSDLDHTEALDVALRKRVVTVDSLRTALAATAYRRGNAGRWAVALDSRSGGWSFPERVAHRLLRANGITGWTANYPFRVDGRDLYFIDIAFERRKLAIEATGGSTGPTSGSSSPIDGVRTISWHRVGACFASPTRWSSSIPMSSSARSGKRSKSD
jgi:hypothetical protein